MPKTLVIVESPAKAKTIEKILGRQYRVKASLGHVRDLPDRDLGIDVDKEFEPEYVIKKEKKQVVEGLRKEARKFDQILLAPDPDREGEAISWHLAQVLELDPQAKVRVSFNEITAPVVKAAVDNPTGIDRRLVEAQQARRVLDRIVGYTLSPLLSVRFRRRRLSAGRVQSVALRLIVEREREIAAFRPREYWSIEADLAANAGRLTARLHAVGDQRLQEKLDGEVKYLLTSEPQARGLEAEARSGGFAVSNVERKERSKHPGPPFITSTLQQAAANRLGFGVGRTMRVAQRLYEGVQLGSEGQVGLITYMRTDSVRVSPQALAEVRSFVAKSYGQAYLPDQPNYYRGRKNANVQDAHEAIRPTSAARTPESLARYLEPEQLKVYTIIWQRFVASQMTSAVFDQTSADIVAGRDGRLLFRASGSVLKFDGHLRVYGVDPEEEEAAGAMTSLVVGEQLGLIGLRPEQHFTQPPPRYTDATLVRTLEDKGIGRPSTYASIIETIESREYAEREGRAFRATPLGMEVTDFLVEAFSKVMEYEFTAGLEEELDQVEEGTLRWSRAVRDFYDPFMSEVENVPKVKCPDCGADLEVKISRYGQFLGCTRYPACTYSRPLEERKEPQPTDLHCDLCQAPVVIKSGRFGEFYACTRFPECKGPTKKDVVDRTGLECPKCLQGEIVKKRSRFGYFYGCNRYPDCDYSARHPLLESRCEVCGWNEMEMKSGVSCSNPDCSRYRGRRLNQKKAPGAAAKPKLRASGRPRRPVSGSGGRRSRAPAAKGDGAAKATPADLAKHLDRLPRTEAELWRLTDAPGGPGLSVERAGESLGLGADEARKRYKAAVFRLRIAFGKARKAGAATRA